MRYFIAISLENVNLETHLGWQIIVKFPKHAFPSPVHFEWCTSWHLHSPLLVGFRGLLEFVLVSSNFLETFYWFSLWLTKLFCESSVYFQKKKCKLSVTTTFSKVTDRELSGYLPQTQTSVIIWIWNLICLHKLCGCALTSSEHRSGESHVIHLSTASSLPQVSLAVLESTKKTAGKTQDWHGCAVHTARRGLAS